METPLTPLEFGRRARKLYPDRVAVIDGDSRWTYAQFLDRCDRWSAVLQKLGIGSRDRGVEKQTELDVSGDERSNHQSGLGAVVRRTSQEP